ncbi:hypothetical protein EVAR_94150_1 [Eumeta japonica]|uniref:Uncharacterized protein n=1 Tax=Eumeta variegata TaxID=151549 RepID=A0A4C1U770_EUMVA|nr:hypothetical protein EVAR_94150_1 [Eumeta japonica]
MEKSEGRPDSGPSRCNWAAHLHRRRPHRRQTRCSSNGMAEHRGDQILNTPTWNLLYGFSSGDGFSSIGSALRPITFWLIKLGATSPRSLQKAELCPILVTARALITRNERAGKLTKRTSGAQTLSPRQQRTMTNFRCRKLKRS